MGTVRIPTRQDYVAYDGAHTKQLWRVLPETWCCPACGRSRFALLRWAKRQPGPTAFEGWIAALHVHHDHLEIGRFPETVVCDLCNAVDGKATARRKALGGSAFFSFAPAELRRFITATPHGNHVVDWAAADVLYERVRPSVAWALINYCAVLRVSLVCPGPGRVRIEDPWGKARGIQLAEVVAAHEADIFRALYPE